MSENNNILNEDSVDKKVNKDTNKTGEGYEFVTEVIKKKPFNKKKLILKLIMSIVMGVIIGMVACVVFVLFEPVLFKKMHPDEVSEISITDEQDEADDNVEEYIEDDEKKESDSNAENTDSQAKENDVVSSESDKPEAVVAEVSKQEEQKETKDDNTKAIVDGFSDFYKELNNIADSAKEYMVEVTGVSDGTDWFNNTYKNENSTFGIIIADNGKELLIITNLDTIKNSNDIDVKFNNGKIYEGYVKSFEGQTGIAVVAVDLNSIDEKTREMVVMAPLGNSVTKTVIGAPVIALGAPLGVKDTMVFGRITSNYSPVELVDMEVRCLTTDIYGADSSSGIIIDFNGKVLGIITKAGVTNDTKNLIRAYSISDLKALIEKLSNGRSVALLGIKGVTVTEEANREYSVPLGVFVKEVTPDSPAMRAGLQNGDVIVKLGTNEIATFEDYKKAMLMCQPGDTLMVTLKRSTREGYIEISYEIELDNANTIY